ncbi:LOLA4 protein, partial [Acromyrmex insinuator]
MYRDYLGCVQRLLPRDRSTLDPKWDLTGSHHPVNCPPVASHAMFLSDKKLAYSSKNWGVAFLRGTKIFARMMTEAASMHNVYVRLLLKFIEASTLENVRRHPLVVWVEDYQAFDTNTTSSIDHQSSDDHTYVDRLRFRQITSRFKCSKCAKSYRWKHHLVEHIKASCGQEKAECCPYCSYKSNRKWNLKSHMKRIHARV